MIRAAAVVAALAWGAPAGAQSLDRVADLAHEGRVQDARAELLSWFDRSREGTPDREELQRAFWLRGALTLDPSQAELDFMRLVVEYPGGPYTDRALQRLARLAVVRGDLSGARRHYDVLARDYPRSPLRGEAAQWMEDHRGRTDAAAVPPATSAERRGRPERRSANPPVAEAPEPSRPEDRVAAGDYTVQVGAFSEAARARALSDHLRASGFEARLVRTTSTPLVRVRVGRFRDAAGATALHDRLRSAGFDSMVVADARAERPAGGD